MYLSLHLIELKLKSTVLLISIYINVRNAGDLCSHSVVVRAANLINTVRGTLAHFLDFTETSIFGSLLIELT